MVELEQSAKVLELLIGLGAHPYHLHDVRYVHLPYIRS